MDDQTKTIVDFETARKNHSVEMESIITEINRTTWNVGKNKTSANRFLFPDVYTFYYMTISTLSADHKSRINIYNLVAKMREYDVIYSRELRKEIISLI